MRWWAAGHDLYDYAQPDRMQGTLPFTYPPFAALVMFPMAWLPLHTVIRIFWVLNVAAVVLTTWWLLEPVAARRGWPRWYALGIAVPVIAGLEPIRESVTFGQVNMLLVVLILGDLLLLAPRHSRWAGVGVGVATAIKLTPAIFILYLLLTRRFRAAATAVASCAVAVALALVYRPQDSWRFFTSAMWESDRVGRVERFSNQSLWGMLARVAAPGHPDRAVWLALVVAVGCVGLWRAATAWRAGDELAGVTLTAVTGALISPVSWNHHLYWFVPILVIMADVAAGTVRPRRRAFIVGVIVLTVATLTVAVIEVFDDYHWIDPASARTPWGFPLANAYLLLLVGFLLWLPVRRLPVGEPPAALLRRRPPTAQPGPTAQPAATAQPAGAAGAAPATRTDHPDAPAADPIG